MSVTIADITFDRVEYDAEADVLYLHIGDPSRAVDFDETLEGHAVRFDRDGHIVGLTLVRPKRTAWPSSVSSKSTAREGSPMWR